MLNIEHSMLNIDRYRFSTLVVFVVYLFAPLVTLPELVEASCGPGCRLLQAVLDHGSTLLRLHTAQEGTIANQPKKGSIARAI